MKDGKEISYGDYVTRKYHKRVESGQPMVEYLDKRRGETSYYLPQFLFLKARNEMEEPATKQQFRKHTSQTCVETIQATKDFHEELSKRSVDSKTFKVCLSFFFLRALFQSQKTV